MLTLKGGLPRHHLVVCSHGVEENPYFIPNRLLRRTFAPHIHQAE
jgi:hypothetical protein